MIVEKLAQIERFLARKGIALQVTREPPIGMEDITDAEKHLGHRIPKDLAHIYIEFGNGFEVSWEDVRSERDFDFARFGLPSIAQFVRDSVRFHQETREQYQEPSDYFDRTEEAQVILRRMLNWGILWDTGGDGDCVCIDLEDGTVLFHEREWPFYDRYVNGYVIAPSLGRLIEDWGTVCFLHFRGCPGHCPAPGGSAVPDYDAQKYNMSKDVAPPDTPTNR